MYGLMAEFDDAEGLLHAAREVYGQGYRRLDAYSPFPIEGLSEAIGFHSSRLPLLTLIGGLCGAFGGYLLQYYAMVVAYPLNVGGRPLNSWPMYIPITFEFAILGAALTAVLGMLALNDLPLPYHPVFNVPAFSEASRKSFFLCVEVRDLRFDEGALRRLFKTLKAKDIYDVEA